ncbi:glycosyltransferase family 39 protein [Pseudomonas moraviensis]|uniref:Putative membrane protein n=1 Tax=Pseudomonas moraviensis TaxID=321662 RepID=A0A7Y9VWY2_9PSED|nr:glycosyltransferase family 39 protein [Pseudomonas moraviensis]NYH10139.1 putative membrane protein [Pseudomonas moraviensis]
MCNEVNSKDWRTYLILGTAVLFGCYLRVRNIELDGLWLDEAFSVAVSDPDNDFFNVYKETMADVHPPFYQVLLWLFFKVFGYAEMTGRYLSMFFGVLLIPAMFFLGRQLFSSRAGLICAWLATVNFYLVAYSQEARSYSLLVLLVVLSFIAFISVLHKCSALNVALYALVVAMLVNTHYFGFLPVGSQVGLFFLVCGRDVFKKKMIVKFLAAGLFVFLTLIPGALYILANFERKGFWVPIPNDRFFVELFSLYFGSLSLCVVVALLMIHGLGALIKDDGKRESLWVLVVWSGVCVLVPYVRSVYFQPVLTMRNLIVVLPAILLLLGYGISLLRERVTFYGVVIVVFCFSMTPLFADTKPVYTLENQFHPNSQMRDVVRGMGEKCSDCLIYSMLFLQFQGYAKVLGLPLQIHGFEVMAADIERSRRPLEFFILSTRGIGEPDADYMKKHGFYLVSNHTIGDSSINEYRSNPR